MSASKGIMLQGKSAIVTGASRGIGREIALAFAENGADLIINGTDDAKLESLKPKSSCAEFDALIKRETSVCLKRRKHFRGCVSIDSEKSISS